jgi:hypothetical protein
MGAPGPATLGYAGGVRALFAFLLPVTLCSLPACTSGEASFKAERAALEAQYRPAITAVGERLEKAHRAALAKPPLKKPSGVWSGPPLVAGNGVVPGVNAVVMVLRAGVCETSFPKDNEPFRFCGAHPYCLEREPRTQDVKLERTDKASVARVVEYTREQLAAAAALRYAVFVETLEAKPPALRLDHFKEGAYRATARVYDLEGAKYLGGFEVGSTSDSVVGYGGSRGAQSELSRDYRDNAAKAWNTALKSFSGGPSRLELGYMFAWE